MTSFAHIHTYVHTYIADSPPHMVPSTYHMPRSSLYATDKDNEGE